MKYLNEIKKGSKIYAECSDGSSYIIFDHIDGMYSHCVSEKGAIIHLSAMTPLVAFNDGYKITEEKK